MNFIKLNSPKLGEIVLNTNHILYMTETGASHTKTFIRTTDGTIGVEETMEDVTAMINNNKARELAENALERWHNLEGGFDTTDELERVYNTLKEIVETFK